MYTRLSSTRLSFTMIELVVVMIVLGILGTVGYSHYANTYEKALKNEAQAHLLVLQAAERVYRQENGNFIACANTAACNGVLNVGLSGTRWDYRVTVAGATFTAVATRVSGSYAGCTQTITQADDSLINVDCNC